jgi:hypothetical protein
MIVTEASKPDRLRGHVRRGFLCALVFALLWSAITGSQGCKSEKVAQRASEPPTPVPTLVGGKTRVGEILVKSVTQKWGTPQLNLAVSGGHPLSIGGQRYQTGFGTHSTSRIEISFPAKYRTFAGSCGVDDEVQERGSVVFKIVGGEKVLFKSPLMKGMTKAVDFSVAVNGLMDLALIVEDGGDGIDSDHADWVNLTLKK